MVPALMGRPARAAETTAAKHEEDAREFLALANASLAGLDDRQMAACLAGMDACYAALGIEQTDRNRTLCRARKTYREAVKVSVARRGSPVEIKGLVLAIAEDGELDIDTADGKYRKPFKAEARP